MATVEVVRLYLNEQDSALEDIVRCLHDEHLVRGVTVFRGISGFGASGRLHEARWMDLALDLPVVVEFFDRPEAAGKARRALAARVPGVHIVHWTAEAELHDGAGDSPHT